MRRAPHGPSGFWCGVSSATCARLSVSLGIVTKHLTYSNVIATLALFVALGGTSFAAVSLARNSVGSKQIRTGAVGASELKSAAVSSRDVRNGSLRIRDLADTTQGALRGPVGPVGPVGPPGPASAPYFASVGERGGRLAGNAATASYDSGTNAYRVTFGRPLDGCAATVTVATAAAQAAQDNGGSYATVANHGNEVVVRTYAANGSPEPRPFNVLLAC